MASFSDLSEDPRLSGPHVPPARRAFGGSTVIAILAALAGFIVFAVLGSQI
jgi:hypothetical protein